jgi:hypothetical protein
MLFNLLIPGLSLRSNPGLKLANAFGVIRQKFQTLLSTRNTILPNRHDVCTRPQRSSDEPQMKPRHRFVLVRAARVQKITHST